MCSLCYSACNTRAPYCHLWPVRLYRILPHYLINDTILPKKDFEHKVCFDYSTSCVWIISLSEKKWAKFYHKYTQVFMQNTRYSYKILIKPGIFYTYFREILKYQILWKYVPGGAEFVPRGETDGHAKLTVVFFFRNFANAPEDNTECIQTCIRNVHVVSVRLSLLWL